MVCARLHIICGNCGSNDMLDYHHEDLEFCDGPDEAPHDGTSIVCSNCSTIHWLSEWQERNGYEEQQNDRD